MNKLRKIFDRIFVLKNFIILLCVVFLVCMAAMKISHDRRQREMKDKIASGLQQAKINEENNKDNDSELASRYNDFNYKEFRTLPSTPELCSDIEYNICISEVLEAQGVTSDKIEGIVIGVDKDGNGIERYYFNDKEIIEKVIEKLEDTELTKMTNTGVDDYKVEPDWDIQLCYADSEYALRIKGEPTNDTRCYRTLVDEVYKIGYTSPRDELGSKFSEIFGSEKQLLFNSDMVEYLGEIIEEQVKVIDMDTALDICTEKEVNWGALFSYKHTPPTYTIDLEHEMAAHIFEFPIEGTNYHILILRQAITGNGLPESDIQRFELYNGDGEFIDMLVAAEVEIREFVK